MYIFLIILSFVAIVAFVLSIIYDDDKFSDEEAEGIRKQLNDWQDRDNLEE